MSELINNRNEFANVRKHLLATASAFTLIISLANAASAQDTDRPTVWIELGGQMETLQGISSPFVAPFVSVMHSPDIYKDAGFISSQNPARFAFGAEGKVSFQPEGSDWIFSAGIRYGRSQSNRHIHKQESVDPVMFTEHYTAFGYTGAYPPALVYPSYDRVADTQSKSRESHFILDFTAGKDVGLGLFGRNGSSTINAGVRIASFEAKSSVTLSARPEVNIQTYIKSFYYGLIHIGLPQATFHQYYMTAHAARSFNGVGPTLAWNASAALVGNNQDGELSFDWGVNAAVLFGKQKAKTDHRTQAYHFTVDRNYPQAYLPRSSHSTRSRSVAVPNLGGFASLSVKYPNAKVSFGYRADFFFGAMDAGIDARRTKNLGFTGPFATISIGLGG